MYQKLFYSIISTNTNKKEYDSLQLVCHVVVDEQLNTTTILVRLCFFDQFAHRRDQQGRS